MKIDSAPISLLALLCTVFSFALPCRGFVPSELVQKGKVLAAGGHFLAASETFNQALSMDPQNQEARFWFAVTRLSAVVSSPEANALLTRLGLPQEGRDLRNFTAEWTYDTNGAPNVPGDFNGTEMVTYLRETLLPELQRAELELSRIIDPDFRIHLGEGQLWEKMEVPSPPGLGLWMNAENVWIDAGDVLNLRAILQFFQYVIYTTHSWNVDLQIETVRRLEMNQMLSIESVLEAYPNLLTFSSTNDLAAARQAFSDGLVLFTNAFARIQDRPTIGSSFQELSVHLFNYDPVSLDTAVRFQHTLQEVHESLNGPVAISEATNLVVHMARHFDGSSSLRDVLPLYYGSTAIAGTLPVPFLGGVLTGLTPEQTDQVYGEFWPMGSGIFEADVAEDALLEMRFHVLASHAYAIEHSVDLSNWVEIAEFAATNAHHWFQFDPGFDDTGYLRLRDLSGEFVSLHGKVLDSCSLLPVAGALVEDLDNGYSTLSNPDGTFLLQTRTPILEDLYYYGWQETHLLASHAEYGELEFYEYEGRNEEDILLSPLSASPPANDDIASRQVLTGWPVATSGTTCGATMDPEDPSAWNQSVWYEWTAPASGEAWLRLASVEPRGHPGFAIFTGTDIDDLTLVPPGLFAGLFEATQGATYFIAIAEDNQLRTFPFTLELTRRPALTVSSPTDGAVLMASQIPFDLELDDPMGLAAQVVISVASRFSFREVEIASLEASASLGFLWESVAPGNYLCFIELLDSQGEIVGRESLEIWVEPPNQAFDQAVELPELSTVVQGSTANASLGGVWYRLTAPYTGPVTFQLASKSSTSSYYYGGFMNMELYSGTEETNLTLLAVADVQQLLTWNVQAGVTYHLYISDYFYAGGTFFLSVSPFVPPTVSLLNPTSPMTWSTLTNLSLAVDAQDADGYICRVDYRAQQFYPYYGGYYYYGPPVGKGELVGSSTNTPFSVSLETLPDGSYVLWAEVFDNVGLRGVSSELVELEVQFTQASSLGDHLDAPQLDWFSGGSKVWETATPTNSHDHVDAARSGRIDDFEQSWIQATVTGPGTLSFWWKVSSEPGADYLEFYLGGDFPELEISGEVGWEQHTFDVPSGSHTLRWRYVKDSYWSEGMDSAWLDEVVFSPLDP